MGVSDKLSLEMLHSGEDFSFSVWFQVEKNVSATIFYKTVIPISSQLVHSR